MWKLQVGELISLADYLEAELPARVFPGARLLPIPTMALPWRGTSEAEPGLLQSIDDPAIQFVYRSGPGGHLFLIGSATVVYEPQFLFKTPWYGTRNLHLLLFLGTTLLYLGALIAWPIGHWAGRRKQPDAARSTPALARLAHWAAALFGLLWLPSLLGLVSVFADIVPGLGVPRIWFGTMPVLNIVLVLAYVLGGFALVILASAVLAWVRRRWSLGGRIFYTLLALLALLLTWSLAYWNLLL